MKYRVDFKPFKGANFGSGIIVYAFSEKTAKKRAIKKARNNPFIPYWKSGTVDATKFRYPTKWQNVSLQPNYTKQAIFATESKKNYTNTYNVNTLPFL